MLNRRLWQHLGSAQTGQDWTQVETGLLRGRLIFFICKLAPYLGIQHNFWSPVPTCGYILCQEPCVIMVWICNAGQAKITDLREREKNEHLRDSNQFNIKISQNKKDNSNNVSNSSYYYYYVADTLLGILHTHSYFILTTWRQWWQPTLERRNRLKESVIGHILRSIPPFIICLPHNNLI